MTYNRYKEKIVKGLAIFLSSMIMAGVCMPVVFAEETTDSEEAKSPVEVTAIYPESKYEDQWFNEETLHHDIWDYNTRNRLFLKVTFDDAKGDLFFDSINGISKLISTTSIYSDSSSITMIDTEFLNDIDIMEVDEKKEFIDKYIFRKNSTSKKAYLYIPVKPLLSHMTYSVTLSEGIVFNGDGNANDNVTWSFNTMAIPSVVEKDIVVQSVIENYDIREPIIISGKFLYSPTVDVYFNNERAYKVYVREDNEGNEYLEVYLPRGRNKLEPGLYDITVENSHNHTKWLYGALSVVSESENRLPSEENKYSTNTAYGDVNGARRAEAIRLDHAEPVKEQMLKNQLQQYILRSPILEVDALGYSIYRFALEIPVDSGVYENYKVLRYDELSRIWVEESSYYINEVDQRVNLVTFNSGIFVVVESKY